MNDPASRAGTRLAERGGRHARLKRLLSWPGALRAIDAWAWGLLALLLGLALTFGLSYREWQRDRQQRHHELHARLAEVQAALANRLRICELAVRAMQSLYLASEVVDAVEFRTAFENLGIDEQLPSLKRLSYAERVVAAGREQYLVRQVQPQSGADNNAGFIGFDVASQPASLAAAQRSRDLDRVVMSAPFRLAQTSHGAPAQQGIALRLPVYSRGPVPTSLAERRQRFRGSLGASFVLPVLIENALYDLDDATWGVAVYDVTDGTRMLLHRTGVPAGAAPVLGARDVQFGMRTWRVHLFRTPNAEAKVHGWVWALLSGTVSSLLLGALVWTVVGARRRAIDVAKAVGTRYRGSEARFRRLNELLPTLVLLVDSEEGRVEYANQVARERLGIDKSGARVASFAPADLAASLGQVRPDQRWSGEALLKGKDGDFWGSVTASGIDVDGRKQWLVVASDISEQRRLTERLSYQASHDGLTRLPNRQAFEAAVTRALDAGGDVTHCLLFIDLDQFKLINDTSGHIAGDQMLVQLSIRMREQLSDQAILARLGGDEFGVLVTGLPDPGQAHAIAERLRAAIDGHVFLWEQRSYIISASVGGVVFTGGNTVLGELLAQADTACYAAKESGRNRVVFYNDDEAASIARRSEMDWAHRIRWALDESRLLLAYQELRPIHGDRGAAGPCVELLLRLLDEEGRLVLPGAFLPAAERYGLMPRIDRWVVDAALANFDRLHTDGAAMAVCAINLSAASLQDDGFADWVLQAIAQHGVEPGRLMFEITETAAVRDLIRAAALVRRLREAGCRVALDDFGAGMSSFGYLKHLGVDTIKIDGAFVADIERDKVSLSIVRAITEIGHQHGLQVVAEWVANPAQVEVLARLGVDVVQGFGIHMPEIALFQRGAHKH